MTEYKTLQIVKHALAHYIKRDGASQKDIDAEKRLLAECKERIDVLQKRYGIPKKGR